MAEVTLEEVTKVFGEDVVAVDKMNLDIPDGEFVVFVGPSGCGKSTALRMIAGLEDITDGKVFIGDQVVNDLPPRQRDIAMVFQNYALYPHMNVRENMGFALKLRKMDKSQINQRVEEAARILSIEHFLDRKPKALSGGQRQRVALGRAIVREPEAMTMADRIVVLKDGIVQQVATPQIMYDQPDNVFVAGFIGSPAMNFIRARLEKENDAHVVVFGGDRIPINRAAMGGARDKGYDPESFTGKEVILGVRPEHIEDAGTEAAEAIGGSGGSNTMEVNPQVIESMGSEKYVYFEVAGEQAAHLESLGDLTGEEDGNVASPDSGTSGEMMVARVSAESTAKEGQQMRLVIDGSKVQLFDPETEKAIF